MCVFLLKEIEILRNELQEASINLDQKQDDLSVGNVMVSTGTQVVAESDEKKCQTSLDNHQSKEITNLQNIIDSVDVLCQSEKPQDISVDVSCQSEKPQDISYALRQSSNVQSDTTTTIDTPYVTKLQGVPFSDFDAEKLVCDIQDFVCINNREVKYYGKFRYSYGRTQHEPCNIPENSYMSKLVHRVASKYPDLVFNSVLVSKFINGNVSLPMHSDNEEEIVKNSDILTVSLGESRTVNFQQKKGGKLVPIQVDHGQVYVMSALSQTDFLHGIPKEPSCTGLRVSLTFRYIQPPNTSYVNAGTPSDRLEEEVTNSQKEIENFLQDLASSPETPAPLEKSSATALLPHKKPVDTLFISSSMFRYLKESELRSDEHTSKVLFYPGATAGGILKKLQVDPSFININPKDISKIYLLCGTNNVDQILEVPWNLYNSAYVDMKRYNDTMLGRTMVEIEHLVMFLNKWSEEATINVINILPRASVARNTVINRLNEFISKLCYNLGHNFVSTELDRYLFSTRHGYRRDDLFNVVGSDNVHLNSAGIVRIGKHLKYLMHHGD